MSRRVEFIEVDLQKCQLEYGVAPCTASIGVTGSEKCFNCRASCQDLSNIDEEPETVRYSKPSSNIRFDLDASPNVTVPNIESVQYAPPALKLGKSIGVRASLTVSFADHRSPDTDASGDKYLSGRSYNPFELGTYWGKFRARYPSIQGAALRWIVGTDDQNIADMETRHFIVDRVAGPTTNGRYTITAKDVLRLTGPDQSVAPVLDVETSLTELTETYTGLLESVPSDSPLALNAPGFLVLGGSEIASYSSSYGGPGVVVLSLTARGLLGTTPTTNTAPDEITLQSVLSYSGEDPADILYDLLVSYAGIDPGYIPLSEWQTESAAYINRTYTTNIGEPTGVETLVNELLEQTASTMWWDNQAQLIRWQVLRQRAVGATVYDDRNTLGGSFNIADDYNRRVSRVFVYFGQVNPLLPLNQLENYNGRVLRTELDSEEFFKNKPAYRTITSRWIPSQGREIAERLGDLILQRFSFPPRSVGFRLLRDTDVQVPELGGAYSASSFELQDFTGRVTQIPIQITGIVPSNTEYVVTGEEITFNELIAPEDPNVVNIPISENSQNVNLRALYDEIGTPPDSDTVVNFSIASGVVIGSGSVSAYALESGDWPVGAEINLVNNGTIAGRAGAGGAGGSWPNIFLGTNLSSAAAGVAGTPGGDGGDAFNDTFGVNLTNNGMIGGGGGGGGAGSAIRGYLRFTNTSSSDPDRPRLSYWGYAPGAGGGGGAGSVSGSGGASGVIANVAPSVNGDPPGTPVAPGSANAGSLTSGGSGGSVGFSSNFVEFGDPSQPESGPLREVVAFFANGGSPGAGGDLGQDGEDGQSYSSNPNGGPSGVTYNSGDFDEYKVFTTNSKTSGDRPEETLGGSAGAAIVQSGATTNILVAGDIRGAIV